MTKATRKARPSSNDPRLLCFALAALTGCETSLLEQSCGGERVLVCGEYEYAEIVSASITPDELRVADFAQEADVRVQLERCEMAPAPHDVELQARVEGDMGSEIVNLTTLGHENDDTPDDPGVVERTIVNPLLTTVPAEADIFLRFTARLSSPGGCASGSYEIPYRTGPRREE